ncbi:MAG TPA: bifunctional 5,10-methylenetetrahydrofolate dehydrogenase/5,10-methenyltetrahydrofolate cyclohydrolase [Patescibacteria group bacterium]
MIIFDGNKRAEEKLSALKTDVDKLVAQGKKLKIAAILYTEDIGSALYTRLKKEAAERIGIEYEVHQFSMRNGVEPVLVKIQELNADPSITGIIIQKPWRKTWVELNRLEGDAKSISQAFNVWWQLQTSQLEISKDVDGLHPETLAAIKNGAWQTEGKVMPATAKAVLEIMGESSPTFEGQRVIIVGKSDILGQPLYYELKNRGVDVEMIGSADLRQRVVDGRKLLDADIIISATGQPNLITGDLVKEGGVVIDVGEPKGDVDFASVSQKASFITPVPGGVGPMTVVCLLENCVDLSF